MEIGRLAHFHEERFFEGAVQLGWAQTRREQARDAATAFVFHGPRYHGAAGADQDGIEGTYRLKDTASFIHDLLGSMRAARDGRDANPFSLAVAGYGSGKSHLALTCAELLGAPTDGTAAAILDHIDRADAELGSGVRDHLVALAKPVLVLPLDGSGDFHLGNALSRAVFTQFDRYGVDAGPIRDLSPRFQTAAEFVARNFAFRADAFSATLPGLDLRAITSGLLDYDESVYAKVDALFAEANGRAIPVEGQESAQDLIATLCSSYCGDDGPFAFVLILFDELGRYLEYAAVKPQLAGDRALQQIFQGVQDNKAGVRFVGLIQYELKAYLKRFGISDLRQLQKDVTRYDEAEKWYLSTNLETIFAHLIGKDEDALDTLWQGTDAPAQSTSTWQRMSASLPGFDRFPVWSDPDTFARIIARGCWPLHPLAVWFLTRQRDVLQSRSALTFIKDLVARIGGENASQDGRLRRVSAAEFLLRTKEEMLPELIAAEHETGGAIFETLQTVLTRLQGHLNAAQELVLAGIAVLTRLRVGKQVQTVANDLLREATALADEPLRLALETLVRESGAVEWNEDLGQYELIADSTTRGVFQQWLRTHQAGLGADGIRDLFVHRGTVDLDLGPITTDFAVSREPMISTPDWLFASQLAHTHTCETAIRGASQQWESTCLWSDPKGQVIYLYLHPDDDVDALNRRIQACLTAELERLQQPRAPIWIIGIVDAQGRMAEHLGRLHLFDQQISAGDRERFRRFVPQERERSLQALKTCVADAVAARVYWIAGFDEAPAGRREIVAQRIFEQIYPRTIPFPFDGFGSAAGGAVDAATLVRGLIGREFSGTWVQIQQRRLQNRVDTLLVNCWKAFDSTRGRLIAPTQPSVAHLYAEVIRSHQDDPQRTLLKSYRALLAPPYGLNSASAGVLLGIFLGLDHPPRRIVLDEVPVASADWVNRAFPVQRRHQLDEEVLGRSRVMFLEEDPEGRWRLFLDKWDALEDYEKQVALAVQARQLLAVDPVPEVLEGRYRELKAKSDQAGIQLLTLQTNVRNLEREIERAVRESSVEHAIKRGFQVLEQRETIVDQPQWPQRYVAECDSLLGFARELIARDAADWIPRKGCQSQIQVNDYLHWIERTAKSLKALGFPREAKELDAHGHRVIQQILEREALRRILTDSDDYPLQAAPTESMPVKRISEDIDQGERLVADLRRAGDKQPSVLSAAEIAARVNAIQARQQVLRAARSRHSDALSGLQASAPAGNEGLRAALAKANRLREIFGETKDADSISEMAVQIERILADIAAWPAGDVSPERLGELLNLQVDYQAGALSTELEAKELDLAWTDLTAIYRTVAQERIEAARRRSAAWLQPRLAPAEVIEAFDQPRCVELEQELMAAPSFLSDEDRARADALLAAVQRRRTLLEEQARRAAVATWQQGFPTLAEIEDLGANDTERLLREIRTPPSELTQDEQERVAPIAASLVAHLDRLSLDELLRRISQLARAQQRQLLERLSELLRSEAV